MSAAYVYRLFDADDRLLYIGCTDNVSRRVNQHISGGTGGGQAVTRYTVDIHPDRETALDAEGAAIYAESPIHNIQRQAPREFSLIGGTFKMMRKAHGVSITELAEKIGTTPWELAAIESGQRDPAYLYERINAAILTLPAPEVSA